MGLLTIYVATLAVVLCGAYASWRVRRECIVDERLSVGTTILVWVVDFLHAGLMGYVAWHGLWPVSLPLGVALLVGSTLVVTGLEIVGAGIRALQSLSRMPGRDEDHLVTTWIYRWSRNPQNTGWILALTGVSVFRQSALALILVGLCIILIHAYLRFVEDPHLTRMFGPTYQQYRSRTPRYLGIRRATTTQSN